LEQAIGVHFTFPSLYSLNELIKIKKNSQGRQQPGCDSNWIHPENSAMSKRPRFIVALIHGDRHEVVPEIKYDAMKTYIWHVGRAACRPPKYTEMKEAGGPQSRYGRGGKYIKPVTSQESNPGCPAHTSYTD
jgi:hypothetical protein